MQTYNLDYNSYEINSSDADKDAINYARCTDFSEYEITLENPCDYRLVETINGVNVYYQFGADYYFFEPVDYINLDDNT